MAPISSETPNASIISCSTQVQAVETVLLFFFANIIAHCLTMKSVHGQRSAWTLFRATAMVLRPIVSGAISFSYLHCFAVGVYSMWTSPDLSSSGTLSRLSHVRRFWNAEDTWLLNSAIASRAVAISIPVKYQEAAKNHGWYQVFKKGKNSMLLPKLYRSMEKSSILRCTTHSSLYLRTSEPQRLRASTLPRLQHWDRQQ